MYERTQKAVRDGLAAPTDFMKMVGLFGAQYTVSKYIRRDNTLENAKYLGYLDARELYPDIKPISFETFLREMLDGKVKKPYEGRF